MSDVVEDTMEEDQLEVEEGRPDRSSSKMFAVAEIPEGKRAKKTVDRLDLQAPKPKEKLKIGDGAGDKLGDIPRTNYQISRMKPADLKPLHSILFDRPGKMASLKKNLRLFNGFPFDSNSQHFNKKREKLLRNSNFTNSKLKVVCSVLDLEKKGTHSDLVDRILMFLVAPKNSGKRVPVKKKKKSKKKLSSDDLKPKSKRSRPKAHSSSPKKSRPGSKSKAIVMDSSSDDDEDEEEEKTGASAEAEGSDGEKTRSPKEGSEEEEESAEEESSRGKKKMSPLKRSRAPTKKTGPPPKRTRRDTSGDSDGSTNPDDKPKKKSAAKTKKADSSSSKNTNTVEDSSDEDEPLIRMIKKAPSDDQLRGTVQGLLKEADLEQMTMKQICQKVFDTYPEHDLSSRKDFIKQTVKAFIT